MPGAIMTGRIKALISEMEQSEMTDTVSANAIATVLNNGVPAVFTPETEKATQRAMVKAVASMAAAIVTAEGKAATSAKDWGRHRLIMLKHYKADADELEAADHAAMDWPNLTGDAGKAIKSKYGLWLSKVRRVARQWKELEQSDKDALFAGTISFLTVADRLVAAEKEAKASKAKADKASETAAAADQAVAAANPAAVPAAAPSLKAVLEAAFLAYADASAEAKEDAAEVMEMLIDAWNDDILAARAAADAADEPLAQAA